MKRRSAIKGKLCAAGHRRECNDRLGSRLAELETRIDIRALVAEVDGITLPVSSALGGSNSNYGAVAEVCWTPARSGYQKTRQKSA